MSTPGDVRGPRGGWPAWSLRRRLVVLFAGVMVATLGAGAVAGAEAWSSRNTVLRVQRTLLPATADAARLLAGMVDEETGERGYLLTSDPALLAPYVSGQVHVSGLFARLSTELGGMPGELADLATVRRSYEGWLGGVARPEVADVMTGHRDVAIAAEATGAGKRSFDTLRGSVAGLSAAIDAEASAANASVDTSVTRTFVLVLVRVFLVAALLALALLLLRRWVIRPLDRLATDVRAVAGGDVDRPVEASGPPELASLGEDVEAMRRRLRDEGDELRQLRQALAEHSPLHLLLHSELEASDESANFSIAGRLLPAEGVLAGDWYDAWALDRTRGAVALVDISGHGPAAGLFALRIKHLLSPALRSGLPPGEAVAWVATELGGSDEQFASGIVLDLDLATGRCRYSNAGHPSGLLFHEGTVAELGPTGPIVGALPGSWRTVDLQLATDDLLVMVTDGVLEARLPGGGEFGQTRIVDVVAGHDRSASTEDIADAVVTAVREACVLPLKDDATVVVVRNRTARGSG